MNIKKILGISCVVIGAVCLFFSNHIARQIAAGKLQIESGQSQVDSYNSYFSATPYSKDLGKQITSPYQKRIDAGNAEITYYESVEKKLQIGGIILILVGIAILIFCRTKKHR